MPLFFSHNVNNQSKDKRQSGIFSRKRCSIPVCPHKEYVCGFRSWRRSDSSSQRDWAYSAERYCFCLLVIEYATHHKGDAPPPPEDEVKAKSSEDIEEWDKEFINVDQGTLFEIILAANYLDIQGLLDLGCKTVANM